MKISQKLISGFLAVALLVGVVGAVALYHQRKIIENNALNAIKEIEKNFLTLKERDAKLLSSALEVFIQNRDFMNIYLEKDRDRLYTYGQPLFESLKNKYGITHFYFILPDGHCFVRLHNKDIYGDLITRFTFWKAQDAKETATGIELGKTAFALRAVMPYYNGDELIGYVEFGEEIDHFLEILKGNTNNEFAVIADKKYLDREEWKSVRQVAGLRDNWDDLEEHVIISDTTEGKAEIARGYWTEENVDRVEEGETLLQRIHTEGKTFACGGFEITDAGGRHAGAILSLIDMTGQATIAQKANFITLSAAIALFIIALGLSILISRSISAPIARLKDAAGEIGKGRLGTKIDVKSKDEIGELARAFNKMSSDLQNSREEIQVQSEELNTTNEELQSSNGELATANEELRVTTKKLEEANEELKVLKESLEKKVSDLERFNKLAVGRELRMKELKERIGELEEKLKEKVNKGG